MTLDLSKIDRSKLTEPELDLVEYLLDEGITLLEYLHERAESLIESIKDADQEDVLELSRNHNITLLHIQNIYRELNNGKDI